MMSAWKIAFKSIRRSPFQALAAFMIVFITLLMVFVFSTAAYVGNQILVFFETQPQLIVFFKKDVTDDQASQVYNQLAQHELLTSKVKELKLVTKEQALEIYKQEYQDNPLLLEMVQAEMLPVSIEVATYDPRMLSEVKALLDDNETIEEISYQQDLVESFLHWTNTIRNVGVGLCLVFLMLTFLVINIIIGMKVVDHRQSIQIMRTIGATKFYVRKPFLAEAFIYTLVSTVLAWLVLFGALYFANDGLQSFLSPSNSMESIFPINNWVLVIGLGVGLLISMVIGQIAAWRAVSRIIRSKS